ncbi:MAG: DUF5906 domain-containing protein [Bacteroidales bacterium]|nr:DUF5906 domain-containing protein [Bacteroidales bacterium]
MVAEEPAMNPVQEFVSTEYDFRRNLLSGKIEFREKGNPAFRIFTLEEQNSVIMAAEACLRGEKRLRDRLLTLIHSRATPDFDPVREWLKSLPEWDGKNHVDAFLNRLPGLNADEHYWLHVWMRSCVAHWLQMDALHGNELVPTLIGEQGCGKSTFCRLLLPEALREYFLDHVNLANKFDKEMALTHNLLVNIDELEQVRPAQQSEMKHLLTKNRVNGRPIYGRAQQDRPRYASFVATTNDRHPLHDPTGSRRFLCIVIPSGRIIDNLSPIDYEQLYAQILSEVRDNKCYWFTEEETHSIQRHNTPYQSTLDLERIVLECFRQPEADEPCHPVSMTQLLDVITREYSFIRPSTGTKMQVGKVLSGLGFQSKREMFGVTYYAVPKV